jgi:predicted TIM-barrel fold metal-dependent hydrolase
MEDHARNRKLSADLPDVVDAQLHLSLALTEECTLASMDALGIRSLIIDELWHFTEDGRAMPCVVLPGNVQRALSPYALAASLKHPDRFAFLQRVHYRDPQLAAVVAELASTPACIAIRIVLPNATERDVFATGGYDEVFSLAQRHNLPLCMLGIDTAALPDILARFPGVRFVLDHCGYARSPQHWEEILELGQHTNLWFKWGHPHRAFRKFPDPDAAMRRGLVQVVEAYGAQRVMWASDLTFDDSGWTWSQLLALVRDNPELSLDHKQWILAGTARKLFRWAATEAPAVASRAA